ncbi:HAMP domain-containing sensor histidine kinase [Rhodococcus sp. IEGM 1408]|uniref:sensor histidine kinase n=1 Tax=Rhodococcus sp. IEGM 1408 TaxID=3082220 RepID=UPI00295464D5|nr:HAMP domain-containing sensor histidine kinase [Rhodococcus sp. IEGM 1408]MDV7999701.1 HAMP domain-containing sensor histidine kinase [Rhodococcus sp. IEGM 1408]
MKRALRRTRSIRWWYSARLRITLGITLTSAAVFAGMVFFTLQLLDLTSERAIDQRLNREAADFSTFVNAGILPSFESETPTAEQLIRAYLAQQYPSSELLLVGTVTSSGTQFTLSRYSSEDDPLFPPSVRSQIQQIGLFSPESTGVIADSVRWNKAVVDGPAGRANIVVAINNQDTQGETDNVADFLLSTSAGGLALSALFAWLIAGRMIVPVRRIREAAETISAADLSRRVPVDGPDEIVSLAETVNAMLDRVEDAYRTQREFLDDAGHELRTPLTVVQGNLDLMPEDPEERAETTRIMQDELSRMTRIVEDLLTLARSDRPDFLRTSPTDVADLVLDVEAKIEVIADREWSVMPYAEGVALLDQHRITQALVQFCSNAVRFTRPGDPIEIGCRVIAPGDPTIAEGLAVGPLPAPPRNETYRRRLLWWVRDNGPGIPPGEEESVFERFHTARGQLRDGRGGTGLGLAIVATIAQAHGGRAFVYNAKGGGAAFCIVVPFVAAAVETEIYAGKSQDRRPRSRRLEDTT